MSNETPNIDVFFDNLQVTHVRGPILEETHYYPFGLTMSGISSKALSFGTKNTLKFNGGAEFDEDIDVSWYETFYRNYDPQIGRFTTIDILSETQIRHSGYHFAYNNPIRFNDPLGDRPPSDLPTYVAGSNGLYKLPNGRVVGWGETQWYLREQGKWNPVWSSGGFEEGEIYSWGGGTSSKTGEQGLRLNFSFIKDRPSMDVGLGSLFLSFAEFNGFQNEINEYFSDIANGKIITGISLAQDLTQHMVVGSQMLANAATGQVATKSLLKEFPTSGLRHLGVAGDIYDVYTSWRDAETSGDYVVAGLKTAWAIGKNAIKATPVGLAVTVIVDVSSALGDIFDWW